MLSLLFALSFPFVVPIVGWYFAACCCGCGAGPFAFDTAGQELGPLGFEAAGPADWSISGGRLHATEEAEDSRAWTESNRPTEGWDSGAVAISANLYKITSTNTIGVWLGHALRVVADWPANRYALEEVDEFGVPLPDTRQEIDSGVAVPADAARVTLNVIGKGAGLYDVRVIINSLTVYTENDRAFPSLDTPQFAAGMTILGGGAFDDFYIGCGVATSCCPTVIPSRLCVLAQTVGRYGCEHNASGVVEYNLETERWEGEISAIEGCSWTPTPLYLECGGDLLLRVGSLAASPLLPLVKQCEPFHLAYCYNRTPGNINSVVYHFAAEGSPLCAPTDPPLSMCGGCNSSNQGFGPAAASLFATLSATGCACLSGVTVELFAQFGCDPVVPLGCHTKSAWLGHFAACGSDWTMVFYHQSAPPIGMGLYLGHFATLDDLPAGASCSLNTSVPPVSCTPFVWRLRGPSGSGRCCSPAETLLEATITE